MVQTETITAKELKIKIGFELARRETARREKARTSLLGFTQYTMPVYQATEFHKLYAKTLDLFADGKIKKLIITQPPQHGKSELSTRRLPAYLLGKNNKLKIALASYNQTKAREFSMDVQRIIADPIYYNIFPNTRISGSKHFNDIIDAKRTQEFFEVYDNNLRIRGNLKAVGRGGPLTGNAVDIMIMDDLYKDYMEGNSPVIRKAVIDWYTSVVKTRLHNDSQELIVFTRWHEDDLIGFIEKESDIEIIKEFKQLEDPDPDKWYKLNFPALQTLDNVSEIDPREVGEALWPEKHSVKKLEEFRKLDIEKFESLYQGDPRPLQGLLLQKPLKTYEGKIQAREIRNYTDTADTGSDYLCSIDYIIGLDNLIYVIDVLYTQEPQEVTEQEVADMISRDRVTTALIESNNGGRAFARNVDRLSGYRTNIEWFHQSENKEARILSNASNIFRLIHFPKNWEYRWPEFHKHVTRFKRNFKANAFDDSLDNLSGIVEHSGILDNNNAL
ncbi:phage terminase large subunit, partial [Candidatus Pacearchaeota archaeon]|nr:phage terminase large subunit [Candidatus Pacearchaeota archaeon]